MPGTSRALARRIGSTQRTVQRDLAKLLEEGVVGRRTWWIDKLTYTWVYYRKETT